MLDRLTEATGKLYEGTDFYLSASRFQPDEDSGDPARLVFTVAYYPKELPEGIDRDAFDRSASLLRHAGFWLDK